MSLTYGSLFSGYLGLDMAVQSVLGGTTSWVSEIESAPSKILAHHWPDVPNLGDVTKVDWASVPKVDVITGGFPCQDVSHAGKRSGLRPGTRTGLWSHMAYAINEIRPSLVVIENVRGLLSATASGDVEPCPWCVGDGEGSPMRALGAVLADLADIGYDTRWYGLRAADLGAAHGRFRIFLFAAPADADRSGWVKHGWGIPVRPEQPAPECSRDAALILLPTPAVNDMGAGKTPDAWDAWTGRMQAAHGNGNGHGKSLEIEALRLLPTPIVSEANGAGAHGTGGADLRTAMSLLPTPRATRGGSGTETRDLLLPTSTAASSEHSIEASVRRANGTGPRSTSDVILSMQQDWGLYAAAIRRQENAFGRLAPPPTELGAKGQPRLSPRFCEWLMGLPEGHVTGVPGISRNDQLKALGNGVVPQQAAAATRAFVHDTTEEAVAS